MRFFASLRACRRACWQVGGSNAPGRARVRHRRAVAERPHVARPLDLERRADDDATPVVQRKVEQPEIGAWPHAGRPDERSRRHHRAVGEHRVLLVERLERRLDVDLDSLPLEVVVRVLPELARDLGEDPRRELDEHPALADVAERRVPATDGVTREVVELGERLDARVAGPDEDEAEVALRLGRVKPCGGGLERAEQAVAERNRVGDVLEAAPVLGEPRDRERPRNRAERDHEPLVLDLERPAERLGDDRLGVRRLG